MANPIDFPGANRVFTGDGETVGDLPTYVNQGMIVSMWALTPDEMAEIVRTGVVCLGVLTRVLPPVIVGSVEVVRAMAADYGGVWER